MRRFWSMRNLGAFWAISAFLIGLFSTWLWLDSQSKWRAHLAQAYTSGVVLFGAMQTGSLPPEGTSYESATFERRNLAASGSLAKLAKLVRPDFTNNIFMERRGAPGTLNQDFTVLIISSGDALRFSGIQSREHASSAEQMGEITRWLASTCSNATLFTRIGGADWLQFQGDAVWGCAAAPHDLRVLAAVLALVALGSILTQVANSTAHFHNFARVLNTRRRIGGPEAYATKGPAELGEIVGAVNTYLRSERAQLAKRATVLSGVSHDLGTPATRLRLRTALIQNDDLRDKFDADIDRMTGIIESVLTYTRSELNAEESHEVSLTSLVEAVVADYQDMGQPVELLEITSAPLRTSGSLFMSKRGKIVVPEMRRVLVQARPVSLHRALSNLIDNALKYGRRARVSLTATSQNAVISVEDEGNDYTDAMLADLMAPFKRGANASAIEGFGMGLTIVATIAEQHGGDLSFEQGRHGLRANLKILRY